MVFYPPVRRRRARIGPEVQVLVAAQASLLPGLNTTWRHGARPQGIHLRLTWAAAMLGAAWLPVARPSVPRRSSEEFWEAQAKIPVARAS